MESEIEVKERSTKNSQYTGWLVASAVTASLVGSFAFGYGTNGANPYFSFYNQLLFGPSQEQGSANATSSISQQLLESLPQTLFVVGCFIGAFTAGLWPKIHSVFDRRACILLTVPFYGLSCIFTLIGFYFPAASGIIFAGRIIHGYGSGLACVVVPAYLHEISTPETAEKIGIFHQLFITIGIFTGNLMGHQSVLGTEHNWIWANIFGIFPVIIGAIFVPFIPKSPKQLLLQYHDDNGARSALQKLRKSEDVDKELKEIAKQAESGNKEKVSYAKIVKDTKYRWPLVTSVALLAGQALSGINAVFFYSGKFLYDINTDQMFVQTSSLVIAALNVLFTFFAFPSINKFGMRKVLMVTMVAMLTSLVLLTILVEVSNSNPQNLGLQWSIVVFLVAFVFFFAIGIGPIAFMYPNDIFERQAVDTALTIGLCFNYAGNIFVSLTFIPLQNGIGGYVFLIYACCVLLTVILFAFKIQGPYIAMEPNSKSENKN